MRGGIRFAAAGLALFLIVGLLLGAVGRVRTAAGMSACRNPMRMWAVGLEEYHVSYGAFPAAVSPGKDLTPERRLSWLFELDPFIVARMDPEWTRYRTEPWDSPNNLRLGRQGMLLAYCPVRGPEIGADGLMLTNYVGAAGVGTDATALPDGDPRAGFFGYDRKLRRDDLKDGASATISVVETTRTGPWIAGGWPSVRGLDPADRPYVGAGQPLGGTHPGGMQAAFADASCRFVRETVNPAVLEALVTTAADDDPGSFPDE